MSDRAKLHRLDDSTRQAIAARCTEHRREFDGKVYVLAIAKEFKCDRGSVYHWDRVINGTGKGAAAAGDEAAADDTIRITEKDDEATIEFTTDKLITSDKEAIESAGFDPLAWRVKEKKYKTWTVAMKVRQGQDASGRARPDRVVTKQNYGWNLRIERIISKPQEDAYNALYARMERRAPTFRPIARTPAADPVLAVIAIEDPHFGKLSWAAETGQDYDLKIAETDYRNAVEDLLRGAAAYNVAEILFLIGSDLAHVDSQANTTTAGTPQDVDGRYAKIVETISAAVVEAIGLAVQIAPVRALLVEGNHGRQTEYHIARYASAYFRNHPDVTIDYSMQPRKYHRYGTTLIGLAHGDKERRSELPIIMATEKPKEWAETTCREWLLGHEHRSKVSHSTPVDGQSGVTVRTLRALTATDAWHHSKGYFANDRAAECYLYREDTGYVGHFLARPRKQAIQRSTAAA
jgi:hypothetical protein